MENAVPKSPEGLLEHLEWVNRLARRLTSDAGLAEDAAQEAAIALATRPPAEGVPVRRWLAGVLRNRLAHGRRSAGRRAAREEAAARGERQPSTLDLVARASVQRQVVDAVLALDEPYRTVVLERYFENVSPSKIARRQGVPVETVKTQLKRGMARLRQRLDSEHGGDGRAWAVALVTHLPLHRGVMGATAAGASIMTLKHFVLPSAATVAAVAAGWWLIQRPGAPGPELEAAAGPQAVALEPAQGTQSAGTTTTRPSGRESVAADSAISAPAAQPDVQTARTMVVDVQVVTADSLPVAGAELVLRPGAGRSNAGRVLGRTDSDGRLRIDMEPRPGFLRVDEEGWTTVLAGSIEGVGGRARGTVVVAPPRNIEGRVLDAGGAALAGATVTYTTETNFWASLEQTIDDVNRVQFHAVSDSSGRFEFLGVPELPESILTAELGGKGSASEAIADHGPVTADLTLVGRIDGPGILSGSVIDAGGQPAVGAMVSLGGETQFSDADGRFWLATDGDLNGDVLRAVAAGALPATVRRAEDGTWPTPLVLRLGTEPLSVAGRVEHEDGTPTAGVKVSLQGGQQFGLVDLNRSGDDPRWSIVSVETAVAGDGSARETITDEAGRFRIDGLLDRDYRVLVEDSATLAAEVSAPFRAGSSDLVVVLPAVPEIQRIAGRVVDSTGAPISDAVLSLRRNLDPDELHEAEPMSVSGDPVTSDSEGRFELRSVATVGLWLHVYAGQEYPARSIDLDSDPGRDDLEDLTIEVPALAAFFIELGERSDFADSFHLIDDDGESAQLYQAMGQGMFWMDSGHFADGRSPVFSATVGEWVLVLTRDGEEVERRTLELTPGEPRRVTF